MCSWRGGGNDVDRTALGTNSASASSNPSWPIIKVVILHLIRLCLKDCSKELYSLVCTKADSPTNLAGDYWGTSWRKFLLLWLPVLDTSLNSLQKKGMKFLFPEEPTPEMSTSPDLSNPSMYVSHLLYYSELYSNNEFTFRILFLMTPIIQKHDSKLRKGNNKEM